MQIHKSYNYIHYYTNHSNPHTSKLFMMKSVLLANTSFPNVPDFELLPFMKSSVKYIPNLPINPPPNPTDLSLPHYI